MSLLMEALRKAEEAKRRMQQEEQAAASNNSQERSSPPRSAGDSAPASSSAFSLEERDDLTPDYIRDNFTAAQNPNASPVEEQPAIEAAEELAPEPEYSPQPAEDLAPSVRTLARRQQRAAAASVFAAKQSPARNRKLLTILVIIMVVMIPAGGGILWYLQSIAGESIGINPNLATYDLSSRELITDNPTTPAATTPAQGAVTQDPAIELSPVEEPAVSAEAVASEAPAETTVAEDNAPADDVAETTVTEPALDPQVAAAAPAATNVAAAAPDAQVGTATETPPITSSVLEISRSRSRSQVYPGLTEAYARLQAGDFPAAGRLYQELLNTLPNNRDALLGLATVNMRQGDAIGARELYARLLQLNPRDPLAHTGLLQTMQISDPAEQERALKLLSAEYPDVAQLTLALGNLYAAQQRWSEAQGAYYNALLIASRSTDGPVHPDYAFNLAVSLEQLNQPKAALDYYRRAQALAREVTPGFDPQLLTSRLAYLEQAQP